MLVEDKPGVLARVASLISRRGFNIQSLAVGATEQKDISRMTIVVNVEDLPLEQVSKQLHKLVNVIKVVEHEDDNFGGPRAGADQGARRRGQPQPGDRGREPVPRQGHRRRARVACRSRCTGTPAKLEALLRVLEPYGVREIVQSGMVSMARGPRSITGGK